MILDVFGQDTTLDKKYDFSYTNGECLANFLTHGFCIPGAIYAFWKLQQASSTWREHFVFSIYGGLLMALFLVSTLYHLIFLLEIRHTCNIFVYKIRPWRHFMLLMDRAVIHLFIAGCYTPWLILRDNGPLGTTICQAMWIATIFAILIQQTGLITNHVYFVIIYLIAGILPGTFMACFMTDKTGLSMLFFGGVYYLIGIGFFFLDGTLPYGHAIWHCCVNLGVYFHFTALHDYLLQERNGSEMISALNPKGIDKMNNFLHRYYFNK